MPLSANNDAPSPEDSFDVSTVTAAPTMAQCNGDVEVGNGDACTPSCVPAESNGRGSRMQNTQKLLSDYQPDSAFSESSDDLDENQGGTSPHKSTPLQPFPADTGNTAAASAQLSSSLSTMATDRRGLFSAEEEVQFAAEVVAKRKDLRAVGRALGRSTGDCVLYYYAHFKQGRRAEYERLKRPMHGGDMGEDITGESDDDQDDDDEDEDEDEDEDDNDEDDDEEEDNDEEAEDPPSASLVAQRLPVKLGSRVLVRFDDGKWYGGRVAGRSDFLGSNTTPSEVCIVYDDGEHETCAYVYS